MTSSRTRTAYAERLSDAEVAEQTKDMSPEDREEFRIENAVNPLFDMWLRFEAAFGDRAIDRLDVTDEDAEAAARRMEATKTDSGAAFAYLLRSIANQILESMAEGAKPAAREGYEVYARWHTYGITSSVQWFQRRKRSVR